MSYVSVTLGRPGHVEVIHRVSYKSARRWVRWYVTENDRWATIWSDDDDCKTIDVFDIDGEYTINGDEIK